MTETLEAHIDRITHGESVRQIAIKIGMTPSTLQRQLDAEVKVGTVVDICRAYDSDLLPAFVAAGFVTEDEAGAMSAGATLRDATDRQLVEELLRRIIAAEDANEEHPDLTSPVTEAMIDAAEALMDDEEDEVAARRAKRDVSGSAEDASTEQRAAGADRTEVGPDDVTP